MKAFDRDGVLVGVLGDWEACHPKRYQNGIEMPLIKEVIQLINEPCIVISNQQGIQKGYVSVETVINQFKWLMTKTSYIEACFFCPDDGETCWQVKGIWTKAYKAIDCLEKYSRFRKPCTGMIELANYLGFQIDTYIGDLSGNPNYADGRDSDLKFAQNANLKYLDVNDFIEGESCKKH